MPKLIPSWSWPVFFKMFWNGFGRMMAGFCAIFLIAPLFADTTYAYFGSVQLGLLFAVVVSVVYGYSEGDRAVRDWREHQSDSDDANSPSANSN